MANDASGGPVIAQAVVELTGDDAKLMASLQAAKEKAAAQMRSIEDEIRRIGNRQMNSKLQEIHADADRRYVEGLTGYRATQNRIAEQEYAALTPATKGFVEQARDAIRPVRQFVGLIGQISGIAGLASAAIYGLTAPIRAAVAEMNRTKQVMDEIAAIRRAAGGSPLGPGGPQTVSDVAAWWKTYNTGQQQAKTLAWEQMQAGALSWKQAVGELKAIEEEVERMKVLVGLQLERASAQDRASQASAAFVDLERARTQEVRSRQTSELQNERELDAIYSEGLQARLKGVNALHEQETAALQDLERQRQRVNIEGATEENKAFLASLDERIRLTKQKFAAQRAELNREGAKSLLSEANTLNNAGLTDEQRARAEYTQRLAELNELRKQYDSEAAKHAADLLEDALARALKRTMRTFQQEWNKVVKDTAAGPYGRDSLDGVVAALGQQTQILMQIANKRGVVY